MTKAESNKDLGELVVETAAANYLECLNLSPNSQVLIVTDAVSVDLSAQPDENTALRVQMAAILQNRLALKGINNHRVEFDHHVSREEMYTQSSQALNDLDELNGAHAHQANTMVVYLGDTWANRKGLYDAASDFGKDRKVQLAGSLGFSTGDCRVMNQMTTERRAAINRASQYFDQFFTDHPQGQLEYTTVDSDGNPHTLSMYYNNAIAPFATDSGWFDGVHVSLIGHFEYLNIPGGEQYAAPFPFQHSQGEFVADGVCLHVTDGMVDGVNATEAVLKSITEKSQIQLIDIIIRGGRIPVSEIGLGLYAIAKIETYPDSSTLSKEKGGPHIGMGTDPSGKSPEAETMEQLSGDFHHTDFVMNNPVITFIDSQSGERLPFYPPQQS